MLRIVFLIEYVKVSLSKNPEDNGKDDGDWSAVNEAAFWLGRADEWGDCNLFSTTSINHSLMVYGNRLSRVFRANDISPRMEPDRGVQECAKEFLDGETKMMRYVADLRKHRQDPGSQETERRLWYSALEFGTPVICAANEIAKIR